MPNNIFINYRREDSSGYSLAIYKELLRHFEKESLFKDFSTIEPGEDFEESINNALNACNVLLVIIGDNWLSILKEREKTGEPDFVRLEIANALEKGIYTIPIAINGAKKPRADELPDDLKKLVKRQYLELDQTRFDNDVSILVSVLKKKLNSSQPITEENANISINKNTQPEIPSSANPPQTVNTNQSRRQYPPSSSNFSDNLKLWLGSSFLLGLISYFAIDKVKYYGDFQNFTIVNCVYLIVCIALSFFKPVKPLLAFGLLLIYPILEALISLTLLGEIISLMAFALYAKLLTLVCSMIISFYKNRTTKIPVN